MFGLVSFPIDLVPVAASGVKEAVQFKLVAPPAVEGDSPRPVQQRYITEDGEILEQSELLRGREVDGAWVVADKDEVAAAKTGGLAANMIELHCHPVQDVESTCRPGGRGYRLRPGRKASASEHELYVTIRGFVEATQDRFALVGSLNLRGTRAIYRLGLWGDQLVFTELLPSAVLAERDVIAGDAEPDKVDRLVELAGMSVTGWDESLHHWDAAAAIADLVGAKEPVGEVAVLNPPTSDNVMAMLEAAVAAKKAEQEKAA